jgi:hypothetical protein
MKFNVSAQRTMGRYGPYNHLCEGATMNRISESGSVRRIITGASLAGVFIAHCLIGFAFYRGRVASGWRICDSDVVVFGVPFLLALAGYAYVLFGPTWSRGRSFASQVLVGAACVVLVLFSTWAYMLIAVNTYRS